MNFRRLLNLTVPFLSLIIFASGCGSDSSVTQTPPTTGTVNGKVVDVVGYPIPNVTAVIGSSNAVTGADGSFSIANVTTPYDVKLVVAASSSGMKYEGISTLTPQLYGLGLTASPSSATLNVTIPNLGVNQKATVFFTDTMLVNSIKTISNPAILAALNVRWQTSAAVTGKILVLVYTTDATGNVTSYNKYGEKTGFTLNNGSTTNVTFSAADLNVTPGSATVSGTLTAPAGFVNPSTSMLLKFSSKGSPLIGAGVGAFVTGASFSFLAPTGLTSIFSIGLEGSANTVAGEQSIKLSAGTVGSSNSITLETPPVLSTPGTGATNVDTTTNFTYSTGTGTGAYIITYTAAGKSFYLITNSTSVKIPSFSSYGLSLGNNTP